MIRLILFLLSIFLSPLVNGQFGDGIDRESKAGRTLYHQIPTTSFRCEEQQWAGYYSDPEAQCQVFHICVRRHGTLEQFSFLCPNETVFHQELLVCVWWDSFDCQSAPLHYGINENIFEDDEIPIGDRSIPNRSRKKELNSSREKSIPKSELTTISVGNPLLETTSTELISGRRGKNIDVTENSISNSQEDPTVTVQPEILATTKSKLQSSPILKLIPKAATKPTADVLTNRNQNVEGRALPQAVVSIDNSAVITSPPITPQANLDFVNNGQFIVRHDNDETLPPQISSRDSTAVSQNLGPFKITNQVENSDAQATGSRASATLSNESSSGKTLQTANEEINTARAFPKAPASQVGLASKRPQNSRRLEQSPIQDKKPRRTTTIKPVTTPKSITITTTSKISAKTTYAFTPFTSSANKTIHNMRTTTTSLPTTTTNLRAAITTLQPANQRRNEKKINAISTASPSLKRLNSNADLLTVQPKSSTTPPRKSTNNRVSSSRAPNSFTTRLSSHDVLHDLLKNITIIRAGELHNANFSKNPRANNVKRKVDNASAPVSSFSETNTDFELSQTFTSSRGVSRLKAPIHKDQKKISSKSTIKFPNSAIENNNRIKSSTTHDSDEPNSLLSCVYYYGSKKRPNCNLVNQRAQDLQNLGLTNLLNTRPILNKIDAKKTENDYSLLLEKEPHDEVISNRRSFSVSGEDFNDVKSSQKQFSVNNKILNNIKSLMPSDQPFKVNQILNIPSTDFSLPSPSSFVFPNVTLSKDRLSSHFLPDFTSFTKNAGKPLILVVSSAEAASNEGNQKKVYINTLKSEKTISTIPPISHLPFSHSHLRPLNSSTPDPSSSSLKLPSSSKANTKPAVSSKFYTPAPSFKTLLPIKSQVASSSKTYLPASSPNYISSKSYLPSSGSKYLPSSTSQSTSSFPTNVPTTDSQGPSDLEDRIHLHFEPPSETRDKRDSSILPPTTILFLVKKDFSADKF